MDTIFLPQLPDPVLPSGLLERVSGAVRLACVQQLLRRVVLFTVGLVGSISYVTSQWVAFWQEARSSSAIEYLRLVASDPDVVLAHAKDFVLGLLESLPVGVLFVASVSLFFLMSAIVAFDAFRHARRALHVYASPLLT